MAFLVRDRVQETSTTTGTGTFTLNGAVTGYQSFGSAIGEGNATYYAIVNSDDSAQWEVGSGVIFGSAPDPITMARVIVYASSNSNAKVNFSAGTKQVFCTYAASRAVIRNTSGRVGIGTDDPLGTLEVTGVEPSIMTRTLTTPPGVPQSAMQIGLGGTAAGAIGTGPSFLFFTNNAASTKTFLGRLTAIIEDTTAGSEKGGIAFSVRQNGADTTANTEVLRITADSKVGIGTTTPSEKLDVTGNIKSTGGIIASASTTPALSVTQTGSGHALYVEDSTSPDATPTVIDNAGRLFVGSEVPYTISGSTAKRVQSHSVGGDAGYSSSFWGNSQAGTSQQLMKSRGTTVGDYAAVTSGDTIGTFLWGGSDGTQFVQSASIISVVDGAVATNSVPGSFRIATTSVGATTPTEKVRITSAGNVGIGTTSPADFGQFVSSGGQAATANASVVARTSGSAQGEKANYSFYSTFEGTADNGTRRTADIIAGFNGSAWGTEYLSFNVGYDGVANDAKNVTYEKVRIANNGNVGINTTSPTEKLDIVGNVKSNKVILNGSTSGSVTLEPPAVAGSTVITLPTTSGTLALVGGAITGTDITTTGNTILGNASTDTLNVGNGDLVKDASGNLLFNSGYGSAAIAYGCRAWVNFNGTGTVAIRASGNVSSITDNGTGNYTINFTNAMPDANYSVTLGSRQDADANQNAYAMRCTRNGLFSTTQVGVVHGYYVNTFTDVLYGLVAIHR